MFSIHYLVIVYNIIKTNNISSNNYLVNTEYAKPKELYLMTVEQLSLNIDLSPALSLYTHILDHILFQLPVSYMKNGNTTYVNLYYIIAYYIMYTYSTESD
jgi:hypothetical protein